MEEPKISTRPIAENRSSYRSWLASEGIPLIEGFFLEDRLARKIAEITFVCESNFKCLMITQ